MFIYIIESLTILSQYVHFCIKFPKFNWVCVRVCVLLVLQQNLKSQIWPSLLFAIDVY